MKLQVVGLQRVRVGLAVNVFTRVTATLVSVGVFMRPKLGFRVRVSVSANRD